MIRPDGPTHDSAEARLLTELASALAAYGAPAHRLEEAVSALAGRLGVSARFFAMPTAVFVTFESEDGPRTSLLEVKSSEVDLSRLVALDRVLNDVWEGACSVEEGVVRIRQIVHAADRFRALVPIVCFAIVSGAAARFFGGGLAEVGVAGMIGLIVGVLCDLARRRREYGRVLEFTAGMVAALIAMGVGSLTPLNVQIVALGGVIFLVPGLTLTMAVTELSTRNLVAGTARLVGALTILVSIGFGVAIGRRLGELAGLDVTGQGATLPDWTMWPALLVVPPALVVLFRARWQDLWIITLAAVVSFVGARMGSLLLGAELGVCAGALLVGLLGNAYARLLNRPAVVASVPGILLLVPGAIGFHSVAAFAAHDAVAGIELAFAMMLVAMALVAGLLLANVALPPRKAL